MNEFEEISSIKSYLKSLKNDKIKLEALYQLKKGIVEGRAAAHHSFEIFVSDVEIDIDEKNDKKIKEIYNYVMEWIDIEIKSIESRLTGKASNEDNSKIGRRFKRGELKEKCEQIATDIGLVKGVKLTQDKIDDVCTLLDNKRFIVIKKSVGSVLRELGYRKKKYY